jgi:cytochrome bd ubiquinol oxidase subunit II
VWVIVAVLGGGAILFPSLGLLFRLALTDRFQAPEQVAPAHPARRLPGAGSGLLGRAAIACVIAGFGLLNVANARWAHAVGVVSYFAFVVLAFLAIIFTALRQGPTAR